MSITMKCLALQGSIANRAAVDTKGEGTWKDVCCPALPSLCRWLMSQMYSRAQTSKIWRELPWNIPFQKHMSAVIQWYEWVAAVSGREALINAGATSYQISPPLTSLSTGYDLPHISHLYIQVHIQRLLAKDDEFKHIFQKLSQLYLSLNPLYLIPKHPLSSIRRCSEKG